MARAAAQPIDSDGSDLDATSDLSEEIPSRRGVRAARIGGSEISVGIPLGLVRHSISVV